MAHWGVQTYLEAEVDNHNIREIQASSPMDQERAACVNLRVWKGCPTVKMWPRKPLPTSYRGFDIYSGYGVGKKSQRNWNSRLCYTWMQVLSLCYFYVQGFS